MKNLNIWKKLTLSEKKWLRNKYRDLTTDRDPYSPYDDWNDVDLLEEIFGKDNLNSTEDKEKEGILITSLQKVLSIKRWAKECTPDNEEAQVTLSVLESLFGKDIERGDDTLLIWSSDEEESLYDKMC